MADFLASPLDRVKEALPNLMVVVGWEYGTGVSTSPATSERYVTAFVEELWRRSLATTYHNTPSQMFADTLEKLLMEPSEDGQVAGEAVESNDGRSNKPQKEREFEEYAKFKFGKLSKAKQAEAAKMWSNKGPEVEGVVPPTQGYVPCKLVSYAAHAERLDKIVEEELNKLKALNEYVAILYKQRPLGVGFCNKTKVLFVVVAVVAFH